MHTTEIVDEDGIRWFCHHNGDYSGDVHFSLQGAMEDLAIIPFGVLAELVGSAMKSEKISELEEQSGAEYIGWVK